MAPVFMNEARRVVAGEAILSGATTENPAERSSIASADELLEALVREHSRLVYRIAYAVLRSHHDAEDATQDTFLRVLRFKAKLTSVDDPKTWLARIAWRVAVDRGKRRSGTRESSLDDPEHTAAEPVSAEIRADDKMQGMQLKGNLETLIAALPPKLREPLILSTIEEMSPREVAATLRINEAAVRSRIFRARQILKHRLKRSLTFEP